MLARLNACVVHASCLDCGRELPDCICVGDFSQTHAVLPAPDCDVCGDALVWRDDGWCCTSCDVELLEPGGAW